MLLTSEYGVHGLVRESENGLASGLEVFLSLSYLTVIIPGKLLLPDVPCTTAKPSRHAISLGDVEHTPCFYVGHFVRSAKCPMLLLRAQMPSRQKCEAGYCGAWVVLVLHLIEERQVSSRICRFMFASIISHDSALRKVLASGVFGYSCICVLTCVGTTSEENI